MRAARLAPLLISLTWLTSACTQAKAPATTQAEAVAAPAKVAKIVFVDKENACDCTRARIDGTWTALEAALGPGATLPVERIHVDTQEAQARAYLEKKPLMVPPGVYFVDDAGGVVAMLEGELTRAQIEAVLKQ